MRLLLYILTALFVFSALQSQELNRGSYNLRVEEMRGVESSVQLTLTGVSGTVLYQISREMPYDTPRPLVHLFADGSVLLVDAFAGVYERYGENGRMTDRVPLNGRVSANHERIGFLKGNDSLAVLFVSEPERAESRLLIVDALGSTKVDEPVSGSFASGIELSPGGTLIALGTYTWNGPSLSHKTEFLKTDGTPVLSIGREFKGGSWSPAGILFAMYGRKEAIVIDVLKNEVLATTDLGDNKVVHEIFWDDSVPLIVCSPSPTFESGTWVYSRLAVLNLSERRPIYQSDLSFRSVKLEKNVAQTSLRIDGRSIRIK